MWCNKWLGRIKSKQRFRRTLYLIGHDLKSNDNINNMYKSTQNYGDEKNKPIPDVNWMTQWETLFKVKSKIYKRWYLNNNTKSSNIEVYKSKNLSYMEF